MTESDFGSDDFFDDEFWFCKGFQEMIAYIILIFEWNFYMKNLNVFYKKYEKKGTLSGVVESSRDRHNHRSKLNRKKMITTIVQYLIYLDAILNDGTHPNIGSILHPTRNANGRFSKPAPDKTIIKILIYFSFI